MSMYRADRPLPMTLIAIGFIFPGIWLIVNAIFAVPFGLCLLLFAPGMLSGGVWMTLLGLSQFVLGLAAWRGDSAMRYLATYGPIIVIALSVFSGLTNNGWSPWTILLSLGALWYFRTPDARRFLRLKAG
jgi:hypothetical protein